MSRSSPKVPKAPKPPNMPTQASYLSRGSATERLGPTNRFLPPPVTGATSQARTGRPSLLGGTA